jgi:glutathione S-transferase
MTAITLYALGNRDRSNRVQWLCGELGIDVDLVWLDGRNREHKARPYLDINPFGAVPGAAFDGIKMFDSGAIMATVLERDSGHALAPPADDPAARAEFWQWFFFGATTLDPAAFRFIGDKMDGADATRLAELRTRVEGLLGPLDGHLRERRHHGRLLSRQSEPPFAARRLPRVGRVSRPAERAPRGAGLFRGNRGARPAALNTIPMVVKRYSHMF